MTGIENVGPLQLLVVAFPGNRFKGTILPELERLKREQIVRVIDMLVVRKDGLGNVMTSTATDLGWEEATAFGSYVGALAGFMAGGPEGVERGSIEGAAEFADGHLFDEDDVFRVTQALPNETTAALLLIEHRWATGLLDAVADAGGIELSNDWLRPEEILSLEPKPAGEGSAG
jgi:uncharacterized membrane protein